MAAERIHPARQVLASIEIRGPEAVWVLGAHLYAILVPLVLVLVTSHHWDYLQATVHDPFLFYIAAVLMAVGSSFEVAQNSIDRWYLTPEVASANGVGFCDMMAFWFVGAGQAFFAVGIGGDAGWVVALSVLSVVVYPFCYLTQTAHFLPQTLIGILIAVLGFMKLGDPSILLSILLGFSTMFFFFALLETGAQVLHGLTTVSASSGIWFFRWAVENGEAGTPESWTLVITVTVLVFAAMAALRPLLNRLPASRRVVAQAAA